MIKPDSVFAIAALLFLFLPATAQAQEHGDFTEAQEIIAAGTPCSELSESQLELLGDYYMELMHPGEIHEIMDARMGGEGSESLRQVHLSMGRANYCGTTGQGVWMQDNSLMGPQMMYGGGMMGYGAFPWYGYRVSALGLVGLVATGIALGVLLALIARKRN